MRGQDFSVDSERSEGERTTVRFRGRLKFRETYEAWEDVRKLTLGDSKYFDLDLSQVETIDGGSAALLIQLKNEIAERHGFSSIVGAKGQVQTLLTLYGQHARVESIQEAPRKLAMLDNIGRAVQAIFRETQESLDYLGDMLLEFFSILKRPRSVDWGGTLRVMERSGPDSVGIVVLINFLIGGILAIQAGEQLKQYGADIFVANLVGLSVIRELGPLMTAIILAGRSGAAFAAEIGTMKVSEELDAMYTMGLSPYRMLVYPRWFAMLAMVPLLTMIAMAVGVAGGLLVAIGTMNLTVTSYVNQTQSAVDFWDVGTGLIKSFFFATTIALVGCERGLATSGGAEGVGRSTTQAVVITIFYLIALDAVFTVIFQLFGV